MKHWNSKFLEQLLQVQETDLKIRELEQEKQSYHQKSKEEDGELSRLKTKIAMVDETFITSESQYQMYFTTLEDIRTAIKGLLTTKSGTPKPRTRSSTEALRIEEEKLSSLVDETAHQLQRLKEERSALVVKAATRTVDLEKTEDGPEAEIKKLDIKIRRLERQREEEVDGLPPLLLKHYDRLRSSRSGIGLTTLRDGVCMVCRMQMPTAVISRMTKGERVTSCPACGRMVARIEIVELIKTAAAHEPQKDFAKKMDIKAGLHRSRLKAKKALAEREAAMASAKEAVAPPKAPSPEKVADKKTKGHNSQPMPLEEVPVVSKAGVEETPSKKEVAKRPESHKPDVKKTAKKAQIKPEAVAKKSSVNAASSTKIAAKKSAKKGAAVKPKAKKAPVKKPEANKNGAKGTAHPKTAAKKTPAKGHASKKKKVGA